MKDGYIRVFSEKLRKTDVLVLLPIYYAGGTAAKDISSNDIAKAVNAAGKSAMVIEDRNKVFNWSGKHNSYIVFGARDDTLSDLAESIAGRLG
jgi:UDP-N-acetylmuramate--alanine ligase